MKCPYCGMEMEHGWLQSARVIFFGKEKHRVSFLPNRNDTVIVSETLKGAWGEAEMCPECRKVIIG